VCDDGDEAWQLGTVTELESDGRPRVRVDGGETGFLCVKQPLSFFFSLVCWKRTPPRCMTTPLNGNFG